MSLENLSTDRMKSDADRVEELAAKAWQDMTEEERAEWLSPMRGAYNYTDLNRVEEAVAYVAERLKEYGYITHLPNTRSWSAADVPTAGDLFRYFFNVGTLREAISVGESTPHTPGSINGFGVNEANDLERILIDVNSVLTHISQAWFYSNDLYSGEVK